MFLPVFLFLIGIVVLLLSANEFVKQSILFSSKLRLSPLIIGTTIVAVGTSIPELVVSLISASKGDIGLGLGNIVGSNIVNILLIMGIAIFLGNIRVGTTKTQKNTLIMVGVTALFILLHFLQEPVISGAILISAFLFFSIMEFYWGVDGRDHEDIVKIRNLAKKYKGVNIWLFVLALLGVIGGGYITVIQAENISALLGLSTTVFGLLATATATSMPELAVTIISQRKGQEKMALGNIIGSNICNLGLIGGLLYFFHGQPDLGIKVWVFLIVSTLLGFLIVTQFSGKRIPKWVGVLLLTTLVGYYGLLIRF